MDWKEKERGKKMMIKRILREFLEGYACENNTTTTPIRNDWAVTHSP
jgi:hypothetical protein